MLEQFLDIAPLEWRGILCAACAGSMIGLERQLLGKPVGIRTAILITMGAYVFMRLGSLDAGNNVDSTRILGQIITGIGFIGAGVIMTRDGVVLGVTSAAAIWMLAAIGAAIGKGLYHQGMVLAVVSVAVLVGVDYLEDKLKSLQRGVHQRVRGFRSKNRDGSNRDEGLQ
jgi:putative Mg2+ transporter-C (MgtC) family protein